MVLTGLPGRQEHSGWMQGSLRLMVNYALSVPSLTGVLGPLRWSVQTTIAVLLTR